LKFTTENTENTEKKSQHFQRKGRKGLRRGREGGSTVARSATNSHWDFGFAGFVTAAIAYSA
jgi:hypothetical protein